MAKKSKTIDYNDICIKVSAIQAEIFKNFLNNFTENHLHIEVPPKLKDNLLYINSTDLIAFTGYIDKKELSEMDFFRFKQDACKQLEQQLIKSLSVEYQAHYKWCLAQVKNQKFGRYLRSD
jgi:hypothetical protein